MAILEGRDDLMEAKFKGASMVDVKLQGVVLKDTLLENVILRSGQEICQYGHSNEFVFP